MLHGTLHLAESRRPASGLIRLRFSSLLLVYKSISPLLLHGSPTSSRSFLLYRPLSFSLISKMEKPLKGEPLPEIITDSDQNRHAEVIQRQSSGRRRLAVRCFACCGISVVIIGIVILVLALTVFKVKSPRLDINGLTLSKFDLGAFSRPESFLSVNATMIADISIKNPNAASFRFQNSTTMFFFNETKVGVVNVPNGNARPHRTTRFNATVDLFVERVAAIAVANLNQTLGILTGSSLNFNITSSSAVSGRVNLWGLYKKNLEVKMNCTITLEASLGKQGIKEKDCKAVVS
ncbi:late embryogenesis abundant protein At1g64065-like [Wolffia australiana]